MSDPQLEAERMALRMQPRTMYYVLDGRFPVPADVSQWNKFFQDHDARRVKSTEIDSEVRVSTVFLGMDHNYSDEGLPLLFESMVFGGPMNEEQWRYSTYREAELGHEILVEKARESRRDR